MIWAKPPARRDDKHLSFGIGCAYIRDFTAIYNFHWQNISDLEILDLVEMQDSKLCVIKVVMFLSVILITKLFMDYECPII